MLKLDLIHTLALAGIVLFIGYGLRRVFAPLARFNIPAPVIGGLVIAVLVAAARHWGVTLFQFDTTLQSPLMIAFFTTIGFGASLSLLRAGGPQVLLFFIVAVVFALLQDILGLFAALTLGMHPLFGVLCGSVTLTGGPATGLAFASLFEQAGITGAASVAVAAAMCGIVSGGLIGGPIGTWLIERHGLKKPLGEPSAKEFPSAVNMAEMQIEQKPGGSPQGEGRESYLLMKCFTAILLAMWAGSWVSRGFTSLGITLPPYIGAMLVASVIRNIDDLTGVIGLSQRVIDNIGAVALSLFIVMALMTLKLWELAGLALPLLVIIALQVALVSLACFGLIYRIMGRDYEAAVMSSGFCGFMLGTAANAMASMETIVERYGVAPRAFLVVPMVGVFLIDFANALIITAFLNFLG